MEDENKPLKKNILGILQIVLILIVLLAMVFLFNNLDNRTKQLEDSLLKKTPNQSNEQVQSSTGNTNSNREIVFSKPEEIPSHLFGVIFSVDEQKLTIKQDSSNDFKYEIPRKEIIKIIQKKINPIYQNEKIDTLMKNAQENPNLLKNAPLELENEISWSELIPTMIINLKPNENGKKEIIVYTKEVENFYQSGQMNQLPPQLNNQQ